MSSPPATVDLILSVAEGQVVLVRRKFPPLGWALPGGFVDVGETLGAAARREALEETGLHVELLEQFFTYSDPSRDVRRHTISTVFLARAQGVPQGGDDAAEAKVFALDDCPTLCFDHGRILADYRHYLRTGQRPRPE